MHGDILRPVIIAFALVAAACGAEAQTVPPIKPGLWQIHTEREVNGQKVPDASERLKNLSPEKRAQYEAMMKRSGLGTGAGGERQVCYSREGLEKSPWTEQTTGCKVDFTTRTASLWKWHTSCPKLGVEADGETDFPDHEHYTVISASKSKIGDTVRESRTTMTGKWMGADCGDLKPLDARP